MDVKERGLLWAARIPAGPEMKNKEEIIWENSVKKSSIWPLPTAER